MRLRGIFLGLLLVAGCEGPKVNLSTPEPIVLDINMRVDIYERSASRTTSSTAPTGDVPTADARRRDRMADIQSFKNSRLVGESRQGLLVVLTKPEGSYGRYVEKIVGEENADRLVVMRGLSEERRVPLDDIQQQQGELWRTRSFNGEWVEVPQDNNTWRWVQKQ